MEHQVTLANQRRFPARPGTSLLDAAHAAGLVLEHGCRTGRCGSCRAQARGALLPLRDDACLSVEERAAGWVLTCAVQAAGDVALDIEDLGPLAGQTLRTLPARIASIQHPAPDVARIALRLPPNSGFAFLPGQTIDVIGPGGTKRSYSVANPPRADGTLELHVRRVEGGVLSGWWFGLAKPGDLLRFEGPRGSFFLRDVADVHLVLLATGTGFAPIQALLQDLAGRAADAQPRSVHLLWGGRTPDDLYARPPALPDLPGLPKLRYTPVLSRADAAWTGARGHVQDVLMADPPPLADTVVYACGSPAMTAAARQTLCAAGLPARRYFCDAFVSA